VLFYIMRRMRISANSEVIRGILVQVPKSAQSFARGSEQPARLGGRAKNPLNALLLSLATVSYFLGDVRAAVAMAFQCTGRGRLTGKPRIPKQVRESSGESQVK
jgi:hypothetical protein